MKITTEGNCFKCSKKIEDDSLFTHFCKDCSGQNELLQKQRQDFEKVLNRIIGKIEDSRNNGEMIIDYCKKIKEQLNQPKTKKENSKQ